MFQKWYDIGKGSVLNDREVDFVVELLKGKFRNKRKTENKYVGR
jgi:hypothetical protein